ncbi:MAG: hypothetical protein EXR50_07015 [Dehalococcoidia bacterium]|nr:hypothetical protein [Dehalococcoidia bacterium]
MAFTRVHHVGMVVNDLEDAQKVYCKGFGMSVDEHRSPLPNGRPGHSGSLATIEFPIGEMFLEVSKPADPNSAEARFVAERSGQGGMHHLCLESGDINSDVKMLVNRGLKIKQLPGMKEWDGTNEVYFDPAGTLGITLGVHPIDHYVPHPAFRGDGTFTGMGHVGIAARDTEEARHLWEDIFGLSQARPGNRENAPREHDPENQGPDDPVSIINFPLGGTLIEISVPPNDQTGTGRYVAQRAPLGAAFHHICPFAPDVHRAIDMGNAAGLRQIGGIPPKEVSIRAVGWFHPRSCIGTLMEIWNMPPAGGTPR